MTVGQQLRQVRVSKRLELFQIAEDIKVSRYYLEAIECDQPERLPGPFFYKAFIKQYCKYLGIDAAPFEQQFSERVGAETLSIEELRQAKFPARERDPIMRAANPQHGDMRFVLAAGALIAVLMGGSVVYTWMQRPDAVEPTTASTATLPAGVRAMTSLPSASSTPQPAATANAQPSTPVAATSASQSQQPQPDANFQNASVVNLTPNIGASDAAISLSISAQEATWMMISSDGKAVYQGILEPAQARILAGKANAVVTIGNAAGVQVKWNGKDLGPLGQRGQVRMLMFTDKGWQFVTSPAAPAEAKPSVQKTDI